MLRNKGKGRAVRALKSTILMNYQFSLFSTNFGGSMSIQDRIAQHEDWKDGIDAFRHAVHSEMQLIKVKLEEIEKHMRLIEFALKQVCLDLDENLTLTRDINNK